MSQLCKDTIEKEILPHLPLNKRGKKCDTTLLLGIVQLILHRIKTGCQWRELPIKQYMSVSYSYQSVFHHFNRWCQLGVWQKIWLHLLRTHRHLLHTLTVQLDGTHTRTSGAVEAVGYQGRKKSKSSNMLVLCDHKGLIIGYSEVIAGNHHDVFEIEKQFRLLMDILKKVNISTDGLIMNADAGFDSPQLRALCAEYGIELNCKLNPKNGKLSDREEYFDEEFYQHRVVIERSFAWLDAYKALLIRFEKTARNWLNCNIVAFIMLICRKKKKC
jgi:transposase